MANQDLTAKILELPGHWMRALIDGAPIRPLHLFCANYTIAFCGYDLEEEAGGLLFRRERVSPPIRAARCSRCRLAAAGSRFNQDDAI